MDGQKGEPSASGKLPVDQPFSVEEFKRRGYEMIDFIAEYYQTIEQYPTLSQVSPGYLAKLLPKEAPEDPQNWDDIMSDVKQHIMPGISHWQSPNFFSYFPAASSFPGMLGEMLSGAFNVIGFSWISSPACTELETIVLDWLGKAISLPDRFLSSGKGGGCIQGTASESVCTALLGAKAAVLSRHPGSSFEDLTSRLVVYTSDQAHSCVAKACMIAGIPQTRFRKLKTDETFALRGETVRAAIEEDIKQGLIPFFLSTTLGTTSSTAFDKLEEIGPICTEHNIWMHIDAAYAGSAFVCPEYQHYLHGVEHASSFCFNPHKWMLTNFDCSTLWVSNRSHLLDALSITPEYLRNKHSESGLVTDYRDWQIPLGRRFRSLKLWFVLRSFGLSGLRTYIREHIRLAQLFESLVRSDDRFEISTERTMALVCFRLKGRSNADNKQLLDAVIADGKYYMVNTLLNDQFVIRMSIGSRTQEPNVRALWERIQSTATSLFPSAVQ